jgi:RimJ/RimL family protein N-acetyltransferase
VILREATVDDVDDILAITETVAAEGRWIGRELPLNAGVTRQRILGSIDNPDHLSLVAIEADDPAESAPLSRGRVIGQLHVGVAPYGVGSLGMLLVPDSRGQGFGRRMVDEAIAWARARGDVHKLELQVWPHNEAALRLYRGCGFEQEGYLRDHYRRRNGELWDAIVMGLQLR